MPDKLDTVLQRLSHLSQVGLLLLAFFGYIYTVRPVYTKSVLEEEIAKKQLEIKDKDKYISNFNNEIEAKKLELARLQNETNSIKSNLNKTTENYTKTKTELETTTKQLHLIKTESTMTLDELKKTKDLSDAYYRQVKFKIIDALQVGTMVACSTVINLTENKKRDFKFLNACIEQTREGEEFKKLFNMLHDNDKVKLNHILGLIDVRTTNDITRLKNEYSVIYSDYVTKLAEYNNKLELLDRNEPKDKMSEEGVTYRIAAIEKRHNLIHLRTNLSLKYIDDETKISEKYHSIIRTNQDWIASQFNPK